MARLFFAVWPDAPAAQALAALAPQVAQVCGGKPVPREKIHLTLAFLGEIAQSRRAAAIAVAENLRAAAFDMTVDRIGIFRRSKVAWAGCSAPPTALQGLQSLLESALRERGFDFEERPFAPHLTLVRKASPPLPRASIPPIAWHVDAFTLVRSEAGTGRYIVEERWDLRG